MKAKTKQELIISLIHDDLIHAKLIYGMNDLGLSTEGYFIDLGNTIIKLMGFTNTQNEQVFMHYLDLQKQAKFVAIIAGSNAMHQLAQDIYHELKFQKSFTYERNK